MKLSLPFSLLLGGSLVKPGWVLYGSPYTLERAATKFQSRRRAKQHVTNFPLIRPSLVELVINGRKELSAWSTDAEGVSSSDKKRGMAAYSSFIHRYALRGLLAWIQAGSASPSSVSSSSSVTGEAWSEFEVPGEEDGNAAASLMAHQLALVKEEFGLSSLPSDRASAEPLLAHLIQLETEYAAAVQNSKQRDTDRGTDIIPDYVSVNASAKQTGGDAVVKQTWDSCRLLEERVKNLWTR